MRERKSILVNLGFVMLALLYLALCFLVLKYNGFTLYNLIVCALSGAIIFIPLKKKFG